MDEMNDPLIAQLRGFLESLKSMKKNTALEVGCGACHVSRDLLQHQFAEIDLMDQAADSIAIARRLKDECPKIGSVYESSMQEFDGHKEYNCIVLRYVTGYLDD